MNDVSDTPASSVCHAEGGKFIAFWRGKLVCKLDGSLRYFANEQAAWGFLERRDAIGSSMIGGRQSGRQDNQPSLLARRSGSRP